MTRRPCTIRSSTRPVATTRLVPCGVEDCLLVRGHRASPDARPGESAARAVAAYLHTHGILAVETHPDVPEHDAGNALLSLAADVGAELLVMGCQRHHPAREWVLGGATRTVLASMTLPVWMAH